MIYAGQFDFLLQSCGTSQQCINLANLVSLACHPLTLGQRVLTEQGTANWLTDLTGLMYELGRRSAELHREEGGG